MEKKGFDLSERGYAIGNSGDATVVCGPHGEKLSMILTIHKNGGKGGTIKMRRKADLIGRPKPFVVTAIYDSITEIVVRRRGQLGEVFLRSYSSETLEVNERKANFLIGESGTVEILSNEDEALTEDLLNTFGLAFQAALNRSYLEMPSGISYGNLCIDAQVIDKSKPRVTATK